MKLNIVLMVFLVSFCTCTGLSGQTIPAAPPEAKIYVEAVDSIDFPTVTVYFRVLDLNPDTPYTLVDENEVVIKEDGSAVTLVPDSFETITRPISVLLLADGSTSMSKIYPTLKQALITFSEKMEEFDDPDELSVALFSEMANRNNIKVVQEFTTEAGAVADAATQLGGMNFDIYNPTYCSSVFKAFHQGVSLCKERSLDQSLDPNFRNLPRMIIALTDGKEAVIAGREDEFMAFEESLDTLTTGNVPCYIIGCGELVDWDPDRRVIAVDEMSQFAEASQGAFCLTTGPEAVTSSSSMFEKIENNFDKIISSHKYLYKMSFLTNDENIDTDTLRDTVVEVGATEGVGTYLPPVVVNEDEDIVLSYPVSPLTTPPPPDQVVWNISLHRDFASPREQLFPLPPDQPDAERRDGYGDSNSFKLDAHFKSPTQAAFIPDGSAEFSHLREPHIRYGVTISPFGATTDETRQGKLIGAFPIYVRDTTPPNISFGMSSRDIPGINEVKVTENPGPDSRYDVPPSSLPRSSRISLKGPNYTPVFEEMEYGPYLINRNEFDLEELSTTAFTFPEAYFSKAHVRLTVSQCAARDNFSFASVSGEEFPINTDYNELLDWMAYLHSGDLPLSVTFPPVDEQRDTVAIEKPCLPQITYEMLMTSIEDGGKAGICWYIERGGEIVPYSDNFDKWVFRTATVIEKAGYPFMSGQETALVIVARDHAGNENTLRMPMKVFGMNFKVKSLSQSSQRGQ
jgi:hypothetical protein